MNILSVGDSEMSYWIVILISWSISMEIEDVLILDSTCGSDSDYISVTPSKDSEAGITDFNL